MKHNVATEFKDMLQEEIIDLAATKGARPIVFTTKKMPCLYFVATSVELKVIEVRLW